MGGADKAFKTGSRIRQEFLDFFARLGHTFVPSSSLVPGDDPTLLFANAGMNQFKDVFLGVGTRPYNRAVNSQKCIRAGGKHNDLEDVGHDSYHHTFFEMLGNWSFGDYFKAEAIRWAWELLTGVWGVDKRRLYATVFAGDAHDNLAADDEAAELWRTATDIDPTHIHLGDKKDNFWEMGETGPCGPCSEIHIDLTDDLSGGPLVNAGDERVIEIWNLVFMQFNRDAAGKLTPLPATHVDTGMGFERICRVLQGVQSNYDIDIFVNLFQAIEEATGARRYSAKADEIADTAYRVVADHIRALTFAISDGAVPSNEGRGYVLRRILRRAARYGRQHLGAGNDGFLYKLVPAVVHEMGEAFGELRENPKRVAEMIRDEEVSFNRTLDRGIALFEAEAGRLASAGKAELPGDVAFELYATYGFPIDLTQLMARERSLGVDMAGYDAAMARHRELSAGAGTAFRAANIVGLPATDDSAKYAATDTSAAVLGWVIDGTFATEGELSKGDQAALALDKTNFYAESGGQIGDAGRIATESGVFAVRDTQAQGSCVLHTGSVESGRISPGQLARLTVDASRMDTRRNHTATHVLNWALREVLGEHVNQAGSTVEPDRLRFDFANPKAVSAEELAEVERLVNGRILADEVVGVNVMPLDAALKIPGVRAIFGEKYPDPVRVVSVGTADPLGETGRQFSVEFCGGTHLSRTSRIGLLKIVSEEAVAKGVRRITAVTGRGAVAHVQSADAALRSATAALKVPPELLADRIAAMQSDIKTLRKQLACGASSPGQDLDALIGSAEMVGDVKVVVGGVSAGSVEQLRLAVDQIRQKGGSNSVVLVGAEMDGKVTLIAGVSDAVIKAHGVKAGDWVREVAAVVGGSGGGKPNMAQAGGKDLAKLPEAYVAAVQWMKQKLAGG